MLLLRRAIWFELKSGEILCKMSDKSKIVSLLSSVGLSFYIFRVRGMDPGIDGPFQFYISLCFVAFVEILQMKGSSGNFRPLSKVTF